MTTLEKLNKHLSTEVTQPNTDYSYKAVATPVECEDGTTLSVQASYMHYCTPRDNTGPYSEVEVWCIPLGVEVTEFTYSPDEPAGYVPIELVVQFIDNHGGFKTTH